jgi:hypothetical protein
MNQSPQALPTQLHCPWRNQYHNQPGCLTDISRRVNQPQVPLLNQSPPLPALHLFADSLCYRTLPESRLLQPFAVTRAPEPTTRRAWGRKNSVNMCVCKNIADSEVYDYDDKANSMFGGPGKVAIGLTTHLARGHNSTLAISLGSIHPSTAGTLLNAVLLWVSMGLKRGH